MKTIKIIVAAILLISLFAFVVASQISSSNRISVEELKDCTTEFYNATEDIYGNVTRTRPTYGTCFNSTNQSYYRCVNGTESYQSYEVIQTQIVLRNKTDCRTHSYVVSINKGSSIEKKEVDFSSWGVCINATEKGCLAIICGTLHGGSARNGIFNGCDGGKSCQKFLFCQDKIQALYKAARSDFVEYDPTFHLSKLTLKEVEE